MCQAPLNGVRLTSCVPVKVESRYTHLHIHAYMHTYRCGAVTTTKQKAEVVRTAFHSEHTPCSALLPKRKGMVLISRLALSCLAGSHVPGCSSGHIQNVYQTSFGLLQAFLVLWPL